MRTDQFDVQLFERAPKLRQTGAGECVRYIYAENTKLIAVEGQRFAKGGEVGAHAREVVEGRLGCDELQIHQA